MPFIRQKFNIMENLDILLAGYSTFLLWVKLTFVTHPVVWKTIMWHLLFLVSKLSSAVFNIWIVTIINPFFILLILIMDQILSYLHGVVIKWKTTQPIIVYNAIKMRIMLELLTEYGQFQVLFVLSLALLSAGKYGFNQLWPLTRPMDKLYACTSLSKRISLFEDTWRT